MDNQQHACRFTRAVELLSKRWTMLIVAELLGGPRRFAGIESALPLLSGKVLADRLRELEAAGIVRRAVYPETPVRIEYSLTDMGRALCPVIGEIAKWADDWIGPADEPCPSQEEMERGEECPEHPAK